MPTEYFSDRENGPRPRTEQNIKPPVWGGIVAIINSLIETGAFGIDFPDICPDGGSPVGTNSGAFSLTACSEIPDLEWPLRTATEDRGQPYAPPVNLMGDLLEFCHRHVAQPIPLVFHKFPRHHHLTFDRAVGQAAFRAQINLILSRNGLAYELRDDGTVQRLSPPVLREALTSAVFRTGDKALDSLLEQARTRFLSPNLEIRRESLEKLWDAWERLKTLDTPDKKRGIAQLLDKASINAIFRELLDKHAQDLTDMGNTFRIRHAETRTVPIEDGAQVDYFFHRLFSMIQLLLAKR